jgi:probable F420-dependent oxidoreductase
VSVRVGVGIAGWPFAEERPEALYDYAQRCEALGLDSLWLTERLAGPAPFLEPMAAIAALAAQTHRLKFGMSVLVLPARNPVVLARQIATIDFLSHGRLLPAFGLGTDDPREQEATGVPKAERAGRTDEAVVLMRRLWTEDHVTHRGRYFQVTDVTVRPRPTLAHRAVWFGGRSAAALRRVGRLGDGWLASAVTPEEVRAAVPVIKRHAADAGRGLEEDHFGVILPYYITDRPAEALTRLAPGLARLRPDLPVERYAAIGPARACADLLAAYVAAGVSKFVLRAVCPPAELVPQLALLAEQVAGPVEASAAG